MMLGTRHRKLLSLWILKVWPYLIILKKEQEKKIEKICFIANRISQQIEVYSFEVTALLSHKRMKLRCLKFLKEMG